jgi:general secretion pathway protein D
MRTFISLLLTGCLLLMPLTVLAKKKGDSHFKKGLQYETAQQWEKAAQEFTLAVAADPANAEYQLHFRRASFNASQAYMQQGRALAEQRDYVGAFNAFRQAYGYDPVNTLSISEMDRMLRLQAIKEGNPPPPPKDADDNGGATPSSGQMTQESATVLKSNTNDVISYSGDLKRFISQLADQLNLNVIFDRMSFAQPKTIDLNLKDVTTAQALDYVFLQEGLFFQKLSRRTILVAEQSRRAQYQQLVLRTFFLSNTDPQKAREIVGQAIPPSVGRPSSIVVPDKETNTLTVRDTAENVRLIGDLLRSIDKERPEVVMDVNIYEVSKNDLLQLGNQIGTASTFNIGGSPGFALLSSQGVLNNASRGVNLSSIVGAVPTTAAAALVIPPSVLTAFQNKTRAKLIASTQVHAFNNEESTARIGQRVPVQTAQAYPFGVQTGQPNQQTGGLGGFPTGGFPVINYEPTGLTLSFTPLVYPNFDVQVKMKIESKDVAGANTLTPTFTERTITGTARIQNNRTMMLASVSQDIESTGRSGLPFLGGLPMVGRLFSSPTRENRQVDIVIAVTPRVLRAPAVTPRDEEMRPSGTLSNPTTGSIALLIREADREDQIAAAHQTPRTAAPSQQLEPSPLVGSSEARDTNPYPTRAPLPDAQANSVVVPQANAPIQNQNTQVATQGQQEDLPSYVPAPKSLINSQGATEVAAVNTGMSGAANAVRTSMPKPIDTSIGKSITPRIAQLKLATSEEPLKVGEKRRVAIELKSDVPLALAVLMLRFDPRVIKVQGVSAGTMFAKDTLAKEAPAKETLPALSHSIDPSGMCLISISALNGVEPMKGPGVMLFIDIEAVGPGDGGLIFDKEKTSLVATDASDVVLDLSPGQSVVKQ